jgi:signal peptidase II
LEAENTGRVSVRAIVLLVAIAVVVLVIDQLAKWWVVANLPYRVPRDVVGNLLIFEYDRNPGAAFSIGTGSTWIFSIVGVAVLIFVIWYARRIRSMVWALVFGLVLGGLMGNLSDRLFRPPGFGVGEVVDFLRIPLLPAIFNLADSAIVAAMILFLILTILGVGLDGRRASKAVATAGGTVTADSVVDDGSREGGSAAPSGAGAADGDARLDVNAGGAPGARTDADTEGDSTSRSTEDGGSTGTGGETDERAQSRVARVGETGLPADGRA